MQQPGYIFVNPYKNLWAVILLTLFFGPIGLLYATFIGSICMLIVTAILFFIPLKGSGLLIILLWIICIYWGAYSVNRYNKKLMQQHLDLQS